MFSLLSINNKRGILKFILYLCLTFFISTNQLVFAQDKNAFEIPRSSVIDIKDPESGKVYPVFIKLPRSYSDNNKKTYPVIYLTDASYSFQIVSGATRLPMNTGKIQEAIIVGISYEKGLKGNLSRVRDYTYINDPTWKLQTGNAQQFINIIHQSIFPYIQKNYKVNDSRTFVGNSLGGLLGAYILFTAPNMFDNYILGSPSVWFKSNDILKINPLMNLNKHNVFIAVGENETPKLNGTVHDMVAGSKQLKLKISSANFPNTKTKLLIIQGATHETAFPTTAIQGLYWLFKKT